MQSRSLANDCRSPAGGLIGPARRIIGRLLHSRPAGDAGADGFVVPSHQMVIVAQLQNLDSRSVQMALPADIINAV